MVTGCRRCGCRWRAGWDEGGLWSGFAASRPGVASPVPAAGVTGGLGRSRGRGRQRGAAVGAHTRLKCQQGGGGEECWLAAGRRRADLGEAADVGSGAPGARALRWQECHVPAKLGRWRFSNTPTCVVLCSVLCRRHGRGAWPGLHVHQQHHRRDGGAQRHYRVQPTGLRSGQPGGGPHVHHVPRVHVQHVLAGQQDGGSGRRRLREGKGGGWVGGREQGGAGGGGCVRGEGRGEGRGRGAGRGVGGKGVRSLVADVGWPGTGHVPTCRPESSRSRCVGSVWGDAVAGWLAGGLGARGMDMMAGRWHGRTRPRTNRSQCIDEGLLGKGSLAGGGEGLGETERGGDLVRAAEEQGSCRTGHPEREGGRGLPPDGAAATA